MQLRGFKATLLRRIGWLVWSKWLAVLLLPLLAYVAGSRGRLFPLMMVCAVLMGLVLFVALRVWETSLRRQFIRESTFPRFLGAKLRAQYPQLGVGDVELVLHGLRQFFMAHLRSQRQLGRWQ